MVDFRRPRLLQISFENAPIFASSCTALFSLPGVENSRNIFLSSARLNPVTLHVNVKPEQFNDSNHDLDHRPPFELLCNTGLKLFLYFRLQGTLSLLYRPYMYMCAMTLYVVRDF